MITLNRLIAGGQLSAIDLLCDRYPAEADQAADPAKEADRLAASFGLRRPTTTAILVVTYNPATHTPAFIHRLWKRRPERNPRFVCGIRELEGLAELAGIGWSLPGAIQPVATPTRRGPAADHHS